MPHKDPEKRREYNQKYYSANSKKFCDDKRKQYAENPEPQLESNRKWAAANPEKMREKHRRWQAANPEKEHAKHSKWYAANREKKLEQNRGWYAAHPEKLREKSSRHRAIERNASIGKVDLEFIWNRANGICYLCGKAIDPSDVHYDHVIHLSKGGSHSNDNLRPTHSRCNVKKSNKIIKWIQDKLF
jgi:hypothetical protein